MASLDMSLDDMIKSRRNSERGRGRGRAPRGRWPRGSFSGRGPGGGSFGGGKMTGPPRGGPLRLNARPSSYTIAKTFRRTRSFPWQRDLFEESLRAAGLPGFENGAKLYVSNLDNRVTNEDIRELFSEIGELKRYAIHYDKSGRPSGSAEVLFARRSDAIQALKRYNNVQLDGKPMKIEILGASFEIPVSARVNLVGGVNGRRTVVMTPGVGRGRGSPAVNRVSGPRIRGGMGSGRARGRGRGRGRGQGRGRKNAVEKSVDELDMELESYYAEAMQT